MNSTCFFILAIVCQFIIGFGNGTSYTAMLTIVIHTFNEKSGVIVGMSESITGLAAMVAPIFGAALYQVIVIMLIDI